MKAVQTIVIVLLAAIALPLMAQTNKDPQVKKEIGKARITVVYGQDHLVLITGRKSSTHNPNIEIVLDSKARKTFDSVLSSKIGSTEQLKDVEGFVVEVTMASVNGKPGLMFTSGSKCVAITKEAFEILCD